MWKLVVIRMSGVTVVDDTEIAVRYAYRVTQESTLTLFAFVYNPKSQLVESFIPSINRRGIPDEPQI